MAERSSESVLRAATWPRLASSLWAAVIRPTRCPYPAPAPSVALGRNRATALVRLAVGSGPRLGFGWRSWPCLYAGSAGVRRDGRRRRRCRGELLRAAAHLVRGAVSRPNEIDLINL